MKANPVILGYILFLTRLIMPQKTRDSQRVVVGTIVSEKRTTAYTVV